MIDVVDEATSPAVGTRCLVHYEELSTTDFFLRGFAKRYSVGADSMASISPSNPL